MYIDRIAVPCISTESRIKTNGDIHDPLYFIFFLHFEGKERFARRITEISEKKLRSRERKKKKRKRDEFETEKEREKKRGGKGEREAKSVKSGRVWRSWLIMQFILTRYVCPPVSYRYANYS